MREAFKWAQRLLENAHAAGEKAYPGADYDIAYANWLLARVLETARGPEQALPLLDEAQRRFETVSRERHSRAAEGMASLCVTDRGHCFLDLGRLEDAAAAFEEGIRHGEQLRDERQVAIVRAQLGTVRFEQRRYRDALEAYEEARERFTLLNEPGTVAGSWHQIGMVHEHAGKPEAAEDSYRKSLAISVQLDDSAGQARTLVQLGNLYYDSLDRPEEAAAFYRHAAEKYAETGDQAHEGQARTNLGATLCKLRRYEEARQEIRRAIECKQDYGHAVAPWTTWGILTDIETGAGDAPAATEAKQKAIACFLAHRRDGGENHEGIGRLCLEVTKLLLAGDASAATALLEQVAADPEVHASFRPFIHALQAIVLGSRDRTLADAPDLDYRMAAEILFLIETLEMPR